MSSQGFRNVWASSPASGSTMMVHLALAEMADEVGIVRANHAAIARAARANEDTVALALRRLVQMRQIEVVEPKRGRRCALLRLFPLTPKEAVFSGGNALTSLPLPPKHSDISVMPNISESAEVTAEPALAVGENLAPVQEDLAHSLGESQTADVDHEAGGTTDTKPIAKHGLSDGAMVGPCDAAKFPSVSGPVPTASINSTDLNRLLKMLGVQPPEEIPLYWWRAEHTSALRALCSDTGLTVDEIAERLRGSGRDFTRIRSIDDLAVAVR
jgi:hypothetical protein